MERRNARRRAAWTTGLAVSILVTAACGDTATGPASNQNDHAATVSVFLKDAPGSVDSVWVQIDDIVLMGDSGQVSLLDTPTELINVTTLLDSATALVANKSIDPGGYRELRFVLGGAVLQTTDGDIYTMGGAEDPNGHPATGTLMCPSCTTSGVKVHLGQDVVLQDGSDNGLLLDFDVTQSFGHQAGKSGKWVMRPVIHGHQGKPDDLEKGEAGGVVTGTVSLAVDEQGNTLAIPTCEEEDRSLEDFVPSATAATLVDDQGDPLKFTGHTSEGGTFQIKGLDFDSYTLGYEAETAFDSTKLVWQATVDPNSVAVDSMNNVVTDVAYTITAVSCDPITP